MLSFVVLHEPPQSNTCLPRRVLIASTSAIIAGVMSVSASPSRTASARSACVALLENRTLRLSGVRRNGLVFQLTSSATPYECRLFCVVPLMLRQL